MIQTTFSDMIEDKFGNDYEETWAAAEQFGTSQTNMLLISLVQQIKEMNRLMYNKWEARN